MFPSLLTAEVVCFGVLLAGFLSTDGRPRGHLESGAYSKIPELAAGRPRERFGGGEDMSFAVSSALTTK